MNSREPEPEQYNKYLLKKQTVSPNILAHIEALTFNDDVPKFAFHKIMINNWPASFEILFDTLCDYFNSSLIPVSPSVQDEITSFYTNNLNLILKIIKLDFNLLYERIIVNIEIIYNDKTSVDFFNKYETINDIVSRVVTRRFINNYELDLSDFSNDAEFLTKKIYFYKLSLLSNFKILMLRIGKETRSVNLSNNNLRDPPLAILNFFIKGTLTVINLSNNNIKFLNKIFSTELYCYKNKLEELWLEGNPLCDDIDAWSYIKILTLKFPKLTHLDGVKLDRNASMLAPVKNFLVTPDALTKAIVEKFLGLYFSFYDEPKRSKMGLFYKTNAKFSMVATIPSEQEANLPHYARLQRNMVHPTDKKQPFPNKGRLNIACLLLQLPRTVHDRTSFTVDVLRHDAKSLVLVVDGTYREVKNGCYFRFRRTFNFFISIPKKKKHKGVTALNITNEMFNVTYMYPQQVESFTYPPVNELPLDLKEPDEDEKDTMLKIFTQISGLKMPKAYDLLIAKNWQLRTALLQVTMDINQNRLSNDDFMELDEPDDPDSCSILDMVE